MEGSTAAEKRALAVAKLKRAASLPRMQNGRRPKMHVEAVSEGERSQGAASVEPDSLSVTPEMRQSPGLDDPTIRTNGPFEITLVEPATPTQAEPPEDLAEQTAEPGNALDQEEFQPVPGAAEAEIDGESTPAKKRRRSRSRSRGSRDLRKLKGAQSPPLPVSSTATPAPPDSSPDEPPVTMSPFLPFTPQVIAPVPSHLAQFQAARLLMTPEPGMFFNTGMYSPISPSTPVPNMPTLEDIAERSNLQRSNSAAARLMALNKLQGGAPELPSRSNTPGLGGLLNGPGLQRNNTFSGPGHTFSGPEPRAAARQILLRRLGERIEKGTDIPDRNGTPRIPPSSGDEDTNRPTTPRRRKRRSRRSSNATPAFVDDLSSTPGDISTAPPTPAPMQTFSSEFNMTPSVPTSDTLLEQHPAFTRRTGESLSDPFSTPIQSIPHATLDSVFHEEDDTPASLAIASSNSTISPHSGLPTLPLSTTSRHLTARPPYSSHDTSFGMGVPMFFEDKTMDANETFPYSPFATPLKEKTSVDDVDEEILYPGSTSRPRQAAEAPVSWVEHPLFRGQGQYEDEEEDIDEEEEEEEVAPDPEEDVDHADEEGQLASVTTFDDYPLKEESSNDPMSDRDRSLEPVSPIEDRPQQYLDDDHDPSFAHVDYVSNTDDVSNIDNISNTLSHLEQEESADKPHTIGLPPTASGGSLPWEDARPIAPSMEQSTSKGRWERVKQSISRPSSRSGRRSRTNSVTGRENTLSVISRESGTSLGSPRADGDGMFAHQQATPPSQSPSASTTFLNLAPAPMPPRSGQVSPMPTASTADLLRYGNSKLFPFPGIVNLQEERNRSKNATPMPESSSPLPPEVASTPSTSTDNSTGAPPSTWSATTARHMPGEPMSQQTSDSNLLARFQHSAVPMTTADSQGSAKYSSRPTTPGILTHSNSAQNLKQSGERGGVKRWFSSRKLFSPVTPVAAAPPSTIQEATALSEISRREPPRIPSISDLLKGKKEDDLSSGWETVMAQPTSGSSSTTSVQSPAPVYGRPPVVDYSGSSSRDTSQSPEQGDSQDHVPSIRNQFMTTSPTHRISSTTPDPTSSLDDYPTRPSSASSSTVSSHYSASKGPATTATGPEVLQRLDEMLGRGSRSPMWASAVDEPPRKLVLSSPVLQVVNNNTVKDRFLFMFNDLLVIAKPILQEHDLLMETKPSPLDRKFIVKNVVHLTELCISGERDDTSSSSQVTPASNPVLQQFVQQFALRPELAISDLFAQARSRDDPTALGQLLFRTVELDRRTLGEYLSRRSSRVVLKAYIDGFKLAGLRLDKAMRIMLISLAVPARTTHSNPLEYLMDALASRWYEANGQSVPYHKDLAIQLCRALLQLNEVMHGPVTDRPGYSTQPRRNITSRDFIAAFGKYDKVGVVSDDLLDQMYLSIRDEKLLHGLSSTATRGEEKITTKRPLPVRLTYKTQSDPIMVRIPVADPHFRIELLGTGLVFDPPVLDFSRSADASFRVTGISLGPKMIMFLRSGSHALFYGGLSLSHEVVVERAFMRNTFQLAFLDGDQDKRKYMFSVDDPLLRHQWIVSIKRQMEIAKSKPNGTASVSTSGFHRAAEALSLAVLRSTLMGTSPMAERTLANMTSVDVALQRVANESAKSGRRASAHVRSKSRSKVYHAHGLGKLEPNPTDSQTPSSYNRSHSGEDGSPCEKTWSGRHLEIVCQQNSSIPLVLSYLQVGSPDPQSTPWSGLQ